MSLILLCVLLLVPHYPLTLFFFSFRMWIKVRNDVSPTVRDHEARLTTLSRDVASLVSSWYTLYNAVRTICRTPPLDKFACAKKIKSVGIRPRCVRLNHTWRSGQFCRFFLSFIMSRSQASSTSSSAPSWLQEFISAVTTQTNLAREHAARSDRAIEHLM